MFRRIWWISRASSPRGTTRRIAERLVTYILWVGLHRSVPGPLERRPDDLPFQFLPSRTLSDRLSATRCEREPVREGFPWTTERLDAAAAATNRPSLTTGAGRIAIGRLPGHAAGKNGPLRTRDWSIPRA